MSKLLNEKGGILELNIKVKCKNKGCDWQGQAVAGRKGHELDGYKCPYCGRDIERARGRYNIYSERAELK